MIVLKDKIKKLFSKKEMIIDETISKWFEQTGSELKKLGLPKDKIDEVTLSSISLIDNYLNNVLMILNKGSRLPAMALLRVSGEFIAKLIYCFQANNHKEQNIRIRRWEKTTLQESKTLYKSIIERYKDFERAKVQKWIDEIDKKLDDFKKVKQLPPSAQIFDMVFGEKHPVGKAGMYQQYLNAVHIDLETLERTKKISTTGIEFMGDVEYSLKDLKFECLTHGYIFFKHLYEHYNLCFEKIQNEYGMLIPQVTCS